ncbi:hypothetical protein GON03_14385 [Nocardioides sp. MAH-18]|uniref:DUF6314 domain-containing protein n=1 Tax=Nocardioides agri TaxID=2682843 RepID=A0A6L6XT45_9ACTN|nr:DUF6314 family protein [Nocardioides sp. CGMCC 1.13656]MBA2955520.1 hypothetical protein [Nocardioides sp. CGMCC 1.13656]MVQ50370.1 hypothetical protein [Nocardioides sp. MAH-18]
MTAAIPAPTDLLGTWTLTRVVRDRWAGERRDVTGTATLTAESPDRVRWTEAGTMTWPGHAVEVQRTLFVDRAASGWLVRFEDGRPFHPWSVGAEVEHPCAPDHYRGRIDVTGHPVSSWRVAWDAVGPEKDYRMETAYDGRR